VELIPDIKQLVIKAKFPFKNNFKTTGILDVDEAAAIYLYSMESKVYKLLNKSCLQRNREESLQPFFPYLKLLLTALNKLPTYQEHVVFRGFKFSSNESKSKVIKLYQQLESNQTRLVMWNLSSTTEKIVTLESEQFCGKTGFRIFFHINAASNKPLSGKNITNYAAISKEAEILFTPGCVFQINGISDLGNDLHMIQLKEVPLSEPMIPLT